jgi:hypothetical protein
MNAEGVSGHRLAVFGESRHVKHRRTSSQHVFYRSAHLNEWQRQFWSVTLADRRFAQALAGA